MLNIEKSREWLTPSDAGFSPEILNEMITVC
jgi:hypothetical protein